MLVRVRSSEGMFRLEVQPGDTVLALKQKIAEELSKRKVTNLQTIQVFTERGDSELSNATTLKAANVNHGDLLNVKFLGTVEETPTEAKSAASTLGYTPPIRKPRLPCPRHGPNGSCVACISFDTIRVKRQEAATCAGISLDRESANYFQAYWRDLAFSVQRVGYLYGYNDEAGWVTVDTIYEPPQEASANNCLVHPSPQEESMVDTLTGLLGLRKVGFIVAHAGSEVTMSSGEMLLSAELQKKAGAKNSEWANVVVSVNEGGEIQFEAYQLSDQFVELFNDEHFLPSEDIKTLKFKEPVFVNSKEVSVVETDYFIVPLAIKDHQGNLTKGFPIENRQFPPSQADLRQHLQDRKSKPFVEKISDFHLLFFLTQFLGITEVAPLAEAVRNRTNISPALLVNELAGL